MEAVEGKLEDNRGQWVMRFRESNVNNKVSSKVK